MGDIKGSSFWMPGLGVGEGTSRLWMRFVKKPENRFPARFYWTRLVPPEFLTRRGRFTSGKVEALRAERGS